MNQIPSDWIAEILEAWWATTDREDASDTMYSVTIPYTDIRDTRSALSSFAAQIIEMRLVNEAQAAVHETSGLHASVTSKTIACRGIYGSDFEPNF
jgi:hypothetical protein